MTDQAFTLFKISVEALYHALPLGGIEGGKHWEWFQPLEPGDFVMEHSTVWHDHKDSIRFGHLISKNDEPMFSDEEWETLKDEYGDQGRPVERVYRIKLLKDGTEMRWTNAVFIRLPKSMAVATEFHRRLDARTANRQALPG